MKRIILSALCLFTVSVGWAQKPVGHWSFIPRVGLNLSNLGDMDIYYMLENPLGDNKMRSKMRPDFMLGGEVEYQLMKPVSVAVGAYYSRQGCRWPTSYQQLGENKEEGFEDMSMKLHYLNIPLTARMYVNDYVSFLAGLQFGKSLSGSYEYTINEINVNPKTGERNYGTPEHHHDKVKGLSSVVCAVPVGVALEYEHVIVDVRYNIPLTRCYKYISKGGNQVLTFSVGYRL